MRANELVGKEIIDINTGERLGVIQKSELLVNTITGMVEALILVQSGWLGKEYEVETIPWQKIKKISTDIIIINK